MEREEYDTLNYLQTLLSKKNPKHFYKQDTLALFVYYIPRIRTPISLYNFVKLFWDNSCYATDRNVQDFQLYLLHDATRAIFEFKYEVSEPTLSVSSFLNTWMQIINSNNNDTITLPHMVILSGILCSAKYKLENLSKKLVFLDDFETPHNLVLNQFNLGIRQNWMSSDKSLMNKKIISLLVSITPVQGNSIIVENDQFNNIVSLILFSKIISPFFINNSELNFASKSFIQRYLGDMVQFIENHCNNNCQKFVQLIYDDVTKSAFNFDSDPKQQEQLQNNFLICIFSILNSCYVANTYAIANDKATIEKIMKIIATLFPLIYKWGKFDNYENVFHKSIFHFSQNVSTDDPNKTIEYLYKKVNENDESSVIFFLECLQNIPLSGKKIDNKYTSIIRENFLQSPTKSIKVNAHLALIHLFGDNVDDIDNVNFIGLFTYINNDLINSHYYKDLTCDQIILIMKKLVFSGTPLSACKDKDYYYYYYIKLFNSIEYELVNQVHCKDFPSIEKLIKSMILLLPDLISHYQSTAAIAKTNMDKTYKNSVRQIIDKLDLVLRYICNNYNDPDEMLKFYWYEVICNKSKWRDNEIGVRWWYKKVLQSKL
ncbi:Pex8p SCDLUD_005070 [Saccharomycodes ludwigii]|uniref:Pex8p n=1 Tax=Saccharomycodes ludwigii TaxID=36035 RepID=UPI001E89CA3A|nr:hypothetical protein SCDLUD_005070 [Saccharomycodes ludwigii]KAH3898742.1 hypothetical protein SCDLUD_005070 [Saccharomycodes ludwigii]